VNYSNACSPCETTSVFSPKNTIHVRNGSSGIFPKPSPILCSFGQLEFWAERRCRSTVDYLALHWRKRGAGLNPQCASVGSSNHQTPHAHDACASALSKLRLLLFPYRVIDDLPASRNGCADCKSFRSPCKRAARSERYCEVARAIPRSVVSIASGNRPASA